MLAGAAFKQAWKILGHDEDAPDATDEQRNWAEVLLAATVQGAIFAGVKAAVDRAGATATRRLARLTRIYAGDTAGWTHTGPAAAHPEPREGLFTVMSDQHAATVLTAAAVIATILIARAALLHQGSPRHPTEPSERHALAPARRRSRRPDRGSEGCGASSGPRRR